MDIIKNIKDYKMNHKQRVFAGYLKENANSYSCVEKITNRTYLQQYFAPENDFLVYCTAVADPAMLVQRKVAS